MDISKLLQSAKSLLASDLHMVVSKPPLCRIHGSIFPIEGYQELTTEDIEQALDQVTSEAEKGVFRKTLELDFGRSLEGVGRIRFNAAMQRGSISLVARLLPSDIPDVDTLGLPDICKELILRPRGLVVVSGPTGSGLYRE